MFCYDSSRFHCFKSSKTCERLLCSFADEETDKRERISSFFSKDQLVMTELINSSVLVANGAANKSLKPLTWTTVKSESDDPQAMYLVIEERYFKKYIIEHHSFNCTNNLNITFMKSPQLAAPHSQEWADGMAEAKTDFPWQRLKSLVLMIS